MAVIIDEALTQALRERDACIAAVEMVADDPKTADLIRGRIGVALQRIVRAAAAPELRDALETLVQSFEDPVSSIHPILAKARAALAKAGRAPAGPLEPEEPQASPGKAGE